MLLSIDNASLMTTVSRIIGVVVIFNVKIAFQAVGDLGVCLTTQVLTGTVPVVDFTLILHSLKHMLFVKDYTFRAMPVLKHC